jgi:hypothetical protein
MSRGRWFVKKCVALTMGCRSLTTKKEVIVVRRFGFSALVLLALAVVTEARADYVSLIPSGAMTGIQGDTNSIAIGICAVLVTICGLGILYKIFTH